jgi:signal transduction histidine kinase
LYRSALVQSLRIKYNEGVSRSVIGIMARKFEEGKFDSGEYYFSLATPFARKAVFDKETYGRLMMNKGTYYYLKGDKVAADKAYYEGLDDVKSRGLAESEIAMRLLYNLHFTKALLNQLPAALQYLQEAEVIAIRRKDNFLREVLIAKANIYLGSKRLDSAKNIVERIIARSNEQFHFNDRIVITSLYERMGKPEWAIPYLTDGIRKAEQARMYLARASMQIMLGRVYNKLGRYREAELVLLPAFNESISKKLDNLGDLCNALIETYRHMGKYQDIAALQEHRYRWREATMTKEHAVALNESNLKYRTAEKDKELASNQLQLTKQKNVLFRQKALIAGISLVALTLLLIFYVFRRSAARKARLKEQELFLLKQQREIDALKFRIEGEEGERQRLAMDLHDGIGSMVSSALMQLSVLERQAPGVSKTDTYIDVTGILRQTASDIRKTANNLMPDSLLRLGLADAVTEYISSLQKPSSMKIDVQFYGDVDASEQRLQLIVYRIIQELALNVVKHSHATKALVQIILNEDYLTITVEDNGRGIQDIEEARGSGIRNIKERVEQLKGLISIDSASGKGTSIHVEFDQKRF